MGKSGCALPLSGPNDNKKFDVYSTWKMGVCCGTYRPESRMQHASDKNSQR
jgi:hypothetical protein